MFEIDRSDCVFLDFDGVIKDSVAVKSDAFEQLFLPFGGEIGQKVRRHHEANGGISRFEKLPLYLSWVGMKSDQELVSEYSDRFSSLVMQGVIESEWVAGVEGFLEKHHQDRDLFLVTATPENEIKEISAALNISHFFHNIIGAPTDKVDAISRLLNEYQIVAERAVMIGDSLSDYQAAVANKVPFVLRRTSLNQGLQRSLDCSMIEDFLDE